MPTLPLCLSDFLDQQGSNATFFAPVPDILGWADAAFVTFGLVDYAGVANAYLESIDPPLPLGTKVSGRVIECPRADGTARISVVIATSKALGFAQSIEALAESGFDFLGTPTIFGAKAQDVAAGATPALGPAHFRTTFVIDYPGAPLPDMVPTINENPGDYAPLTLDFRSTTVGALPDGTRAVLHIQQVAATDAEGNLVFSREIVEIQ